MVLLRSQACEIASHDKKAFEDALERSKKRIELLESLITAFLTVFRKSHPNIPITVYLRSTALDTALTAPGNITIVHGTFEEYGRIEQLSATHSIIINCAASFTVPVTEAILKWIHATKVSSKPILLHLSGTGNFVDQSRLGGYIPQKNPFNDSKPSHVRKIDASYPPNRASDELILAAAAKGELNAFFVCSGGIYGTRTNHLGLSASAASAKAPGVWVLWNLKNVQELGFSPYDTCEPEDVYSKFYIAVNEAPEAKPVAEAYGELLFRMGKIASSIPKQVTCEEAGKVAGYIAGNTTVEAVNAKSLGWKTSSTGLL